MSMTKRNRIYFAGWCLTLALAVFAGCTRGAGDAAVAPPDATTGGIFRQAEVPDGVLTDSGLTVPRGFQVNLFAQGLTNPRRIAIAPGSTPTRYDVFVAESQANRISVLRDSDGDGKSDQKFTFTTQV